MIYKFTYEISHDIVSANVHLKRISGYLLFSNTDFFSQEIAENININWQQKLKLK